MRFHSRFSMLSILLAVAVAVLAGACGDDDGTPTETGAPAAAAAPDAVDVVVDAAPVVAFTVADYLIEPPVGPAAGGPTTVELTNNGADFHHVQLWRFADTDAALAAADAIEAGDLRVLADGVAVGGVGAIPGGGSVGTIAVDLDAGAYVSFCLIHTPAGAHNELGMVAPFEVGPASGAEALSPADAELVVTPYAYELPDDWDGSTPLRIVNAREYPVDAEFLRLDPGRSRDDFLAFIDGGAGPPPFQVVGGVTGLGPDSQAVFTDGLEPGTYLVASFQPDPARDGVPQFLTGLLVEFTVE